MEADRERAAAKEEVVEAPQRERGAEPAPLSLAQVQKQDLPEQVGEVVGRRVGVAARLGEGIRPFEAGVLDEEVGSLLDRDLAAVHPDVEDDPGSPPDGVGGKGDAK